MAHRVLARSSYSRPIPLAVRFASSSDWLVTLFQAKGVFNSLLEVRLHSQIIQALKFYFVVLRTDRDERDSNYDYKPCYSEIQAQAGFYGDGHIVYGEETRLKQTLLHVLSFALLLSDSSLFMLLLLCFTDSNYTWPAKTEIEIFFRSTTRSGLLLSITNSSGPGSVTVEQLDGQVR